MEIARADTVAEYKASQSFIDSCGGYYGVGFEDCLRQAKCLYPHLDFSKVTMDEPVPSTPAGDIIQEETNDSMESRQRMIVSSSPNRQQMPPSHLWSCPLSSKLLKTLPPGVRLTGTLQTLQLHNFMYFFFLLIYSASKTL